MERDLQRDEPGARISEYWEWIAVALFLLLSVDLLTSLFAAAEYGLHAEANPVMAWILEQPVEIIVAVHLGVAVLAIGFFYGLMEMLRATPASYRRWFAFTIECWLGLLVSVGLAVFANNLSIIVLGRGLF